MKQRTRQIACYVPAQTADAFAQYARAHGTSISIALSMLIEQVIAGKPLANDQVDPRTLFIETAVDALLGKHPDKALRAYTHEVYRDRLREAGLTR
ncbi:hypothetical protein [Thermaurantiacus sp.]